MKSNKNKKHSTKLSAKTIKAPLSPTKKKLFTLLTVLIPVLFFVFLETGLHIFHYGCNTRLFVSSPDATSRFLGINSNVGKRYFYRESFVPSPRKDLFLKEKPENGYRIFVLGGSTTAGFPYGNNLTFTRILCRRLADTFPDRRIEVINTALTAVNSYTLLDFMDEILAQKPDALLIYAGHNEFYGALGVASMESLGRFRPMVKLYLKLDNFKTFVLVRDFIGYIYRKLYGASLAEIMQDPMKTVMSRMVAKKTIPYQSKLYKACNNQFQANLRDILKKAQQAGIPVLLSDLVCNVRDQAPFNSVESDTFPAAASIYKQAQALEKEKLFAKAKDTFTYAKDLDALRFRASEELNDIIRRTAAEFTVPVVPMQAVFANASPNGLIGNSLIHEHLHPNIEGYFLMADAFYIAMQQAKFIAPDWPEANIKPSSYYRKNWGFTKLDSVYAALSIVQLKGGWPFKTDGPNVALKQFKPQCKEDSLSLRILITGESTLEMAHVAMADWYKKQGDPEKALAEYKALVYTVPYLDLFYESYIELMLTTGQYERTLQMLEEALKYNDSGFIYKWIGQIQLALNYTSEGITTLEKARLQLPADDQLLFNLGRAYYKSLQYSQGDAVLARLQKLVPGSPAIRELEDYKQANTGRQ